MIALFPDPEEAVDARPLDPGFAVAVGYGLPGMLGPVVGWAEVVLAGLLLVGVWHRVAVAGLTGIILVALATVQIPAGVTAGLERDLLVLAGMATLAALGPGRYAVQQP